MLKQDMADAEKFETTALAIVGQIPELQRLKVVGQDPTQLAQANLEEIDIPPWEKPPGPPPAPEKPPAYIDDDFKVYVDGLPETATWRWLEKHFAFSRNDFDSPSVDAVLEQAMMEAMCPEGLDGLIIDPYNYIDRCGKFQADMETEFVKSMLSAVKRFAHEHKVHVWFVSHPAKSASPAERPSMYTIAGSANWFNKTDNGIVIHRTYTPIGFNDEPIQTNQTEFVVEKIRNKEAGGLGQVDMTFDTKTRSYHILSDDDDYDDGVAFI